MDIAFTAINVMFNLLILINDLPIGKDDRGFIICFFIISLSLDL